MGKKLQKLQLGTALGAALLIAACGRAPDQAATNAPADDGLNLFADLGPAAGSLPLSDAAPAGPVRAAPAARALPAAQPLAYAYDDGPDDDDYQWIDRAGLLLDTIDDGPPDYAFDYDGVEPWGWQLADGYRVYAEPLDDGYRYYYYGPGANDPFLVRDPYYSYGYRDGRVAAVYDARGRYLDRRAAERQAQDASRY